jgi:hypothetical protein
MRTFDTDVIKNHQAMAPVEDRCKKGLRDSPELLFFMPDEPNAGTIVNSIRALEDHIILCGMEGAFNIIAGGPSGLELCFFIPPAGLKKLPLGFLLGKNVCKLAICVAITIGLGGRHIQC